MTFEERRFQAMLAMTQALDMAREMQISVHAIIDVGGAICSTVAVHDANYDMRFLDAIPIPRVTQPVKTSIPIKGTP